MIKPAITIAISSILFLSLLILMINAGILLPADITAQSISELSDWHNIVNIRYNSFFSWRLTELISVIAVPLSNFTTYNITAAFASSLCIFFSGLITYFAIKHEGCRVSDLLLSLTLSLCVPLLLQLDSTVVHSLAFAPWLLICTERFLLNKRFITIETFLFLIALYLLHDSSNQLAPLVSAFIFAMAIHSFPESSLQNKLILLFIPIVFCLTTANAPVPLSPDYPPLSHVVPDDNLPGNVMPLIGPFPPIPFINRTELKGILYLPSAVVFIVSLIFWLRHRENEKKAHYLALIAVCCMLEAFFPDSISVISPLYSINRLIPGMIYIPLLPLFIACWLFMFAILLSRSPASSLIASILMIVLPILSERRAFDMQLLNEKPKILVSPSYNVIREAGSSILAKEKQNFTFTRLSYDDFESINSSHNQDHKTFENMFDSKERTRWSPQLGRQEGDEWISFKFREPVTILGLYMNTGNFKADFPRGIDIEASTTCSDFYSIYQANVWQGKVSFNADGYPYFDSQSDVKIILDKPTDVKCLRIRQTGKSSHFDWSIAELELIR